MHPKIGVGVIVVRDGKILLGKRRSEHGNGTWSFPGGHLEMGETPIECAKRELKEETGLMAVNLTFCGLTNDVFSDEKHYMTLFFFAKANGEPQTLEPEKCERWEWFNPKELPNPLFLPIKNLVDKRYIYASAELKNLLGI